MSLEWKDVAGALPKGLELIGGALRMTGIAAPEGAALSGIGSLLAHALGTADTPDAVHAALVGLTADQQAALLDLQENNKLEMQRMLIAAQTARITADSSAQSEVNQTMRVEDQTRANDWRQFWGYISALAFAISCIGVFIIAGGALFGGHAEQLAQIPLIVGSLTTLFAVPCAVLGVTAWHSGKADVAAAQT